MFLFFACLLLALAASSISPPLTVGLLAAAIALVVIDHHEYR
jgi:hypothetical protein